MSTEKNEFLVQFSEEAPFQMPVLSLATTLKQEHTATNPGSLKSKRKRTAFNSFHLIQLENEYVSNNYLDKTRRYSIAQRLSLSEKVIKIWFQNRRMKGKKESQLPEANPNTAHSSQLKVDQTVHKDTVQRLMAYSRFPAVETSSRMQETQPSDPHSTCALDLNEILNLLEEKSTHSSSPILSTGSSYYTYVLGEHTIQQNLELSPEIWLSDYDSNNLNSISVAENTVAHRTQPLLQQTPNTTNVTPIPSTNLAWGEPTSKRQRRM